MLMLREKLGIEPKQPITREDLAGLILAKNVGDDEHSFDEAVYADEMETLDSVPRV